MLSVNLKSLYKKTYILLPRMSYGILEDKKKSGKPVLFYNADYKRRSLIQSILFSQRTPF